MQINLRSIIREMLLQEEVFGALAYVYTGSTTAPETFIPMIINDELDPGRGSGNMYGRGLYTVYDLPGTQTEKGIYGNYIYKLAVNLYGFICFDSDVAEKVYGRPISVLDQMEMLGLDKVIIDYATRRLTSSPKQDKFTSDQALAVSNHIKGAVKGIVFTGRHDGRVAVIYDANTVVPVSYTEVGSNEWIKIDTESQKQAAGRLQVGWRPERYEKSDIEKYKQAENVMINSIINLKKLIKHHDPNGKVFDGDLVLSRVDTSGSRIGRGFTDLPDNLHVKGSLFLDPETTILPQGLRVDGNLVASETKIREIPSGIYVGGDISLPTFLESLPNDVTVGSVSNLGYRTNIREWPPNFVVLSGNINLSGTRITNLPTGFTVQRNLDLTNTPIRTLPKRLKVRGDLILKGTFINTIPDDAEIGGLIYMNVKYSNMIPTKMRGKIRNTH